MKPQRCATEFTRRGGPAVAHLVDAVALLLYPSGLVDVAAWRSARFSLGRSDTSLAMNEWKDVAKNEWKDVAKNEWKDVAKTRFPEQSHLVDESEKVPEFLEKLAKADLPYSSDTAIRYGMALDTFLMDMLCIDDRFLMRRGVSKGFRAVKNMLEAIESPPSVVADKHAAAAMDKLVDAYFLSEDDPPQEASAWLKAGAGRCTLGELATTSSSLRLVKAAYKAGAVKIWAVAIDRYPDGSENTGKLVIELPHDHEARMSILKWVSRKIHSIPPEELSDSGQHYEFVMLD